MPRVVTFGEIMLRLSCPGHQRFAQATDLEVHFGGAEANVAVTIAQLGGAADFVTKLPRNELGQRCATELRGYGVGTASIAWGGDRIGVYFIEHGASQRATLVIYDRAGSAFAKASRSDFVWDTTLSDARWFHWSGITPAISPATAEAVADALVCAKRLGLTVSFDMNFRAKLWSPNQARTTLLPLINGVDVFLCGLDEARSVFGIVAADEPEAARALREQFGFRVIAMPRRLSESASRTSWSAILHTEGTTFFSREHQIDIVDRVGAGDSLTGALIFSLLRGDPPQQAIEFAVAASALKHTVHGDYNLVSLAEVEALTAGAGGGRVRR